MTKNNNESINIETLDAYICGLLSKEEKQRVAKLIEITPEYQTYINMQKKYINVATQAGWLNENGDLSLPEHVMKGDEKSIEDIPLKLISCVMETAEKITIKTIEGLGGAFGLASERPLIAMGGRKEKKLTKSICAEENDDYHINFYESVKEKKILVKLSEIKKDKDVKGVLIQLQDNSGKVIGMAITDSKGKATIKISNKNLI
ncbi:MAG: hypothetical protein HOC71_08215 [Candidatus Latescibacteria bacterium]|nr:hypothetical protein [Candidatus Latescibacterota bacterium]